MKRYRYLLRSYFRFLKEKFFLLFLLLCGTVALNFEKTNSQFFLYNVNLSLADNFIFLCFGFQFYFNVVLIPNFFLSLLIEKDFSANYLLRSRGAPFLWYEHVFLAFINLLLFVLFHILLVFVLKLPNTTSVINFGDKHSYLAFATNGKTVTGIEFYEIFIFVLIFLLLAGMFFNILFLFFRWIFNNWLWSFVIFLIFAFFDISNVFGICTNFGVDHSKWVNFNPTLSVQLFLFVILAFKTGSFFSHRKEFFYAR